MTGGTTHTLRPSPCLLQVTSQTLYISIQNYSPHLFHPKRILEVCNLTEIKYVDIKSAYLNVLLKETVFMKLPRGVLKPGQEGKVLRLLKGLYRLQAGRGWYQEMS